MHSHLKSIETLKKISQAKQHNIEPMACTCIVLDIHVHVHIQYMYMYIYICIHVYSTCTELYLAATCISNLKLTMYTYVYMYMYNIHTCIYKCQHVHAWVYNISTVQKDKAIETRSVAEWGSRGVHGHEHVTSEGGFGCLKWGQSVHLSSRPAPLSLYCTLQEHIHTQTLPPTSTSKRICTRSWIHVFTNFQSTGHFPACPVIYVYIITLVWGERVWGPDLKTS